MKEPCKFLCFKDFIELYKIQINPLKFCGLISALKCLYNKNFPNESSTDVSVKPDSFLNSFLESSKGNRIVYKKLVSLKSYAPEKSQLKWNTIVSQEGCKADWKAAYTLASKGTKSSTLINFQYRLLHRILPTNFFLTKIGIKQDPQCSFCSKAPENIIHLFWYCPKVSFFWRVLTVKLLECELIPHDYLKDIAIFLGLKPDTTKFALQLNFCFLIARHYIWRCKTSNKVPQLNMFLAVLKSQFKIESYKQAPTSKKWDPLMPLFNNYC